MRNKLLKIGNLKEVEVPKLVLSFRSYDYLLDKAPKYIEIVFLGKLFMEAAGSIASNANSRGNLIFDKRSRLYASIQS